MNATATLSRKTPLAILLLVSLLIFFSAYVLNFAVRWTDLRGGLLSGLFHGVFVLIWWFIVVLPLTLLIHWCYRKRTWRHRNAAMLAPTLFFVAWFGADLIENPPTAAARFHGTTGVRLPAKMTHLRTHFSGGGISDFDDHYSFRCSTAETERLFTELSAWPRNEEYWGVQPPDASWPNPDTWSWKRAVYGERDGWTYSLATDRSGELVYINVGCF